MIVCVPTGTGRYVLEIVKNMEIPSRRLREQKKTLGYLLLSIARLSDKLRKFLHADRLGEILVNASAESIRPRLFASNAGQGADVGSLEIVGTFVFADLGRGFEAVHDWHVHLRKNQSRNPKVCFFFRFWKHSRPLESGSTCPDFP
jgi:hypothetical protein